MLSRVFSAARALAMPTALSVALLGVAGAGALAQAPATTPAATTPAAITPPSTTPAVTTPAATTRPAVANVAPGVTVAKIDLGGLSASAAKAKLRAAAAHLQRNVSVQVAAHKYRLGASRAGYSIDVAASVRAALAAKRARAVAPVVQYSAKNVRAFAKKVAMAEYRAPRNARISITVTAMRVTPHLVGRRIDVTALSNAIVGALKDPTLPRLFQPKRLAVAATVTRGTLKKQYSTVLTADRSSHKLRLFKGLRLSKTYSIAVGMAGHDTPAGLYKIQNKTVNPTWSVPNSAWAGSLAGTTIPGGAPNNPLKARWLGIADGVGIHGTSDDNSIGSNASHGCLRMHVSDVIDLYPRVPVGTTILIK